MFTKLTAGSGLKVALVAGKKDFQSEQAVLVRQSVGPDGKVTWASNADVVVATKGRLLDHIDKTEGFDLTHVRFFVIDEADRQMEDIYDDWLSQIEAAMYKPKPGVVGAYHRSVPGQTVVGTKDIVMYPQKLLFSATLSQNPEKLEHLSLFMPMLYTYKGFGQWSGEAKVKKESDSVVDGNTGAAKNQDQFSAPENLKEMFMDCKAAEKPLVLLHFIINKNYENVLCFANSVESAHRLYLLAKQMKGVSVAELSSNVHTEKRERIIRKFERGQIKLLICSDVMTRGMDIENVKYVFSYDAPSYIETYIHRVGRTARANKTGTAITLLEGKEAFHFKKMLRDSQRWEKLKRIHVNRHELEPLVPEFQEALKILPQILKVSIHILLFNN